MMTDYASGFGFWEWLMLGFAVIALFLVIPFAIFDVVRSKYLSIGQKFIWILFILIAPYIGAVIYLFWGRKQKAL